MKFAEHLTAHLTPEWRTQYVDYDELKDWLYKCLDEAPKEEDVVERHQYFVLSDEKFFTQCERQLEKINNFFVEKVAESKRKLENLEWELKEYRIQSAERMFARSHLTLEIKSETPRKPAVVEAKEVKSDTPNSKHGARPCRKEERKKKQKRVRKLHGIKLAFQEFYLNLILLQNFQTLNFTGFRKILKKHDKLFGLSSGYQWRVRNVESSVFNSSKEVTAFITRVEQIYIEELEQGNRQVAMKRLRVPPLTEQVVSIVIASVYVDINPWQPSMRLFRGSLLIVFFLFCLGVNTYGWRSNGVNHVLIFEIDPRNHLNHTDILLLAGSLAVAWALSVQVFIFSMWIGIPTYLSPLILTGFMAAFFFNPLPICEQKSRKWLLRILFRIFTAPMHPVAFADFWLADQLNSLATVFIDLEFFVCFYSSQFSYPSMRHLLVNPGVNATNYTAPNYVSEFGGICATSLYGITPVIMCLPAWFRFAQCLRRYYDMKERHAFPHLVNAGKYSMTFIIVLVSTLYKEFYYPTLLGLWISVCLIATFYTYSWDIFMDWGLMDKPSEGKFLRDELVYRRKWYYYVAIVEDLILRLAWTVDLTYKGLRLPSNPIVSGLLAMGEVFRRFVWNFFRLENEHLNNCGQFRAVRDIYIEPVRSHEPGESLDVPDETPNAPKRYAPYLYAGLGTSTEKVGSRPESVQLITSNRSNLEPENTETDFFYRSNNQLNISYVDAYPRKDDNDLLYPNS